MARSDSSRPRGSRKPTVEETSAGGLVVDTTGAEVRLALIGRLDRRGQLTWSLPKGHIERGESAEEAAVREIREETGIQGQVLTRLGAIDFWFMADHGRIHKTVHHFLLRAIGGELNADDVEVVESQWFTFAEATERLAYPDERTLLTSAQQWLTENPQAVT